MNNENKILLFLVDDDAVFLKSLEIEFLQLEQFQIKTFATGELCLTYMQKFGIDTAQHPDIVILDYHLDGIDKNALNGLTILDNIKAINEKIPVIMLSAQDKIEIAVSCMHHKALDYVVKSETAFLRLQKIIASILQYQKMEKTIDWYSERI